MTRRVFGPLACRVALLSALGAAPVTAQAVGTREERSSVQQPQVAWARVTYLSGQSVYIDAGTSAGVREGMALTIVRGGVTIAELQVAFVSSTRAACTIVQATVGVMVGDSARYTPAREAGESRDSVDANSAAKPAIVRGGRSGSRSLRGRLGVRYLAIASGAVSNGFTQPGVDARLDGRLGQTPLAIAVDARAHRTRLTGDDTVRRSAGATRVYHAAVQLQGEGRPARVSLGRQFATGVSPIGLFDGVAADFTFPRWSTGAFGGTQPDPVDFGHSTLVREYGAWLQAHNPPGSAGMWSFATAAVGSYQAGEVNREFLYFQGVLVTRTLSIYASQEVDYNRDWKTDAGESSTTPTSTFATVRVSPVNAVAFTAGIDNRRSVRLYRDFINPETEFDDSFRRGVWGGASAAVGEHLELAADVRSSDGGPAGRATSQSASLGAVRLTPLRFGIRARFTTYSGQALTGELQTASIEMSPIASLRLEVSGGLRRDGPSGGVVATDRLRWLGGDMDLSLGRSVYLMLSMQYESRGAERGRQTYTALSWRF